MIKMKVFSGLGQGRTGVLVALMIFFAFALAARLPAQEAETLDGSAPVVADGAEAGDSDAQSTLVAEEVVIAPPPPP
jgi:hypothetical protein